MKSIRVFEPTTNPFSAAERIMALRDAVVDAGIAWVLAKRDLATAQARFNDAHPTDPARQVSREIQTEFQKRFLLAHTEEHKALKRYKNAADTLVAALEGKP